MPPGGAPPPPAGPQPPYQPPSQPPGGYYQPPATPPPGRRGTPWGAIIGLGCLALLIALAVGGTLAYKAVSRNLPPEVKQGIEEIKQQSQKAKEDLEKAKETGEKVKETGEKVKETVGKISDLVPTSTAAGPSKEAALKAALEGRPKWVGKVQYISDDLQRAKVWVGPAGKEYVDAVVLQWDSAANKYQVERVDVLPKVGESPAAKPAAKASTKKPTRSLAVARALAEAPERGWVARVTRNSSDWTRVSVMIGPPASEFLGEFDLRWDAASGKYKIVARRSVGN